MPPSIENSTVIERERYIKDTYHCIGDCDSCGICVIFKNKDPLIVFKEYIEGKVSYEDILKQYR